MNAIRVYRLSDNPTRGRLYLDGKRVSPAAWHTAHYGRRTDSYHSRMFDRSDGSVIVREYHCIRISLGANSQ